MGRPAARGDVVAVTAVHGFAQTLGCLGPLAEALARRGPLTLVDAPGHASSLRHLDADVATGAALVAATAGGGVLVGYSMGARLCLRAALDHPGTLTGLVLVSGTAGIDDAAERAERRARDDALAERLEVIGVEAFVDEWLSMEMFASLPHWARFDAERARNSPAGLAASLRRVGTGSMTPLWGRLSRLSVPVLCVTGGDDRRYVELADRLVAGVGGAARHVTIPGAGHAVHLERPSETIAAIAAWLDEVQRTGAPGPGSNRRPTPGAQAPTNSPTAREAP